GVRGCVVGGRSGRRATAARRRASSDGQRSGSVDHLPRVRHAAYPAVKAVAPALPVLISMAGTDTSFLASLYADGVRGYYDGIALGGTSLTPKPAWGAFVSTLSALGVRGRTKTSARLIAVRRP